MVLISSYNSSIYGIEFIEKQTKMKKDVMEWRKEEVTLFLNYANLFSNRNSFNGLKADR